MEGPLDGKTAKYQVLKTDGTPVDPGAKYLVLRIDKREPAAMMALGAFLDAIWMRGEDALEAHLRRFFDLGEDVAPAVLRHEPFGGRAPRDLTPDVIALVREVADENPSWGAEKIRAEVNARRRIESGAPKAMQRGLSRETVRAALAVIETNRRGLPVASRAARGTSPAPGGDAASPGSQRREFPPHSCGEYECGGDECPGCGGAYSEEEVAAIKAMHQAGKLKCAECFEPTNAHAAACSDRWSP